MCLFILLVFAQIRHNRLYILLGSMIELRLFWISVLYVLNKAFCFFAWFNNNR